MNVLKQHTNKFTCIVGLQGPISLSSISFLIMDSNVYYYIVHNRPPVDITLCHMNPVPTLLSYVIILHINICVSRIAQPVQCLAKSWRTGRSRFHPRQWRKDFSSSLCVQTGSGAHQASCTMFTGGPFPRAKARPGRDADHSPQVVPRSRLSKCYIPPSPKRLRGV
jgi:hypothetical protein